MNTYKLVADSGSTKTAWALVNESTSEVVNIRTKGFNPYFHSSEFISAEIAKEFSKANLNFLEIVEIFYYGAGCSSPDKNRIVETALRDLFPNAAITIGHDLVGAARACLGNEDGIACIIGTGSNSCVWEDGQVVDNIPSHGYVFGDEGSGALLGIQLAKLYLQNELSEEIKMAFEKRFGFKENDILNATYKKKDPNVFLAQFASFYEEFPSDPVFKKILIQNFRSFFVTRITPYNSKFRNLGFVGSISHHYEEALKEVAQEFGYKINRICKCPIDELIKFHGKEVKVITE